MFLLCVLLLLVTFTAADDSVVYLFDKNCTNCNNIKIPLEMILRLNTITNEHQLFRDFVIQPSELEQPFVKTMRKPELLSPDSISERFGGESEPVERKAFTIPKAAGCNPEMKSVSLRLTEDPWIYYWPSCTRVEQCGGCCSHQLLSCQAVDWEQINFQVLVMEYVGNKLISKGKEIVPVNRHTKCKCDCITKEKDCNSMQEYRKGECRCVCKNKDAEAKCNTDNGTLHWNSETCSCECLQVFECSTGTFFSQSSCSCEPIQEKTELGNRFAYTGAPTNLQYSKPYRPWRPFSTYLDNRRTIAT